MAIFNNTVLEESNVEFEYDIHGIEPTMECAQNILYEFNAGVTNTISALYVADIMIESAVSEGVDNVETLVEGTVGDALTKAKEYFKDFINKVKAWFKRIITNIQDNSKRINAFVKKNETKIMNKVATNEQISSDNRYVIMRRELELEYKKEPPKVRFEKFTKEYNKYIHELNQCVLKGESPNKDEIDDLNNKVMSLKTDFEKDISNDGRDPFDVKGRITVDKSMVETSVTECKNAINTINEIKIYEKTVMNSLETCIDMIKKMENSNSIKSEYTIKLIPIYKKLTSELFNITTQVILAQNRYITTHFVFLKKFLETNLTENIKTFD